MPKATAVFCIHCQQYISRARERAHRKKHYAPFQSPPPRIPSQLRRVFDVDDDGPAQASDQELRAIQSRYLADDNVNGTTSSVTDL